jgi:hypothetical protein
VDLAQVVDRGGKVDAADFLLRQAHLPRDNHRQLELHVDLAAHDSNRFMQLLAIVSTLRQVIVLPMKMT